MKLNTAFFRALVAIIAGGLLIEYQEEVVKVATKVIGVLFFLSGVISIVIYYVNHRKRTETVPTEGEVNPQKSVAGESLPIVGLGSCILGGILFFMTTQFIQWVMIIFAAILILGAIGEFFALIHGGVPFFHGLGFWILPCLLFLFGLAAIIYPETIASMPFVFLGIGLIVYGLSEVINFFKIRAIRKAMEREQLLNVVHNDNDISDAEVVE